ncbi:orotidine-5'-phosphate decarboxylase [Rhodoferax sp. AJA081-3]|uniref:orotidine-5'-phosphate decarboxylase n=1 Tax=Rhodoferax sp. AJA081-3 TaxID=2752316 RepID=UPI001AE0734C|nr:orotidine-5'-phosphate decarboxylase [Rhodoferax sp. AJA081-3]QTN26143.1 orotidine-5'-phosphate decarboxylase [Rhodoferax sp. AJA081-3]
MADYPLHQNSRVIIALDFDSASQAMALVDRLGASATHYKIGLQLLTSEGPSIVRALVSQGKQVFLDLKLHEIPGSVAGAVEAAGKLGVSMVTVHASGGSAVLQAAVAAAKPFPALKVLALTVITSLSDDDLKDIGIQDAVPVQVARLARLAMAAGCHGVIASPGEAAMLKEILPHDALIVTPGIQLFGAVQSRSASPQAAVQAGATHVVIGGAITRAQDPGAAFALACVQIQAA